MMHSFLLKKNKRNIIALILFINFIYIIKSNNCPPGTEKTNSNTCRKCSEGYY